MLRLLRQVKHLAQGSGDEAAIAHEVRRKLEVILRWPVIDGHPLVAGKSRHQRTAQYLQARLDGDPQAWASCSAGCSPMRWQGRRRGGVRAAEPELAG